MTETSAAHLGYLYTESCDNGGYYEARLVAYAAGRVLVDTQTVYVVELQLVTRVAYCEGEGGGLLDGHTLEVDRHAKCRCLIVGNLALNVAVDEPLYFFFGERETVALLPDYVKHTHVRYLLI